jgi:integrase/recombinase XerD
VSRARPTRSLPVYPTLSEVHRILAECEHERDRLLIELLWHTGGRVSEVVAIRVGDLTASGIRMRNLKQSVPTEKHVFCQPELLARLRAWSSGKRPEVVLVGRLVDGKQLTRERAWQIVTAAGRRAHVEKKRFAADSLRPPWPHSFRHGNAVNLLEQGVPVTAVQAQLGHSSLGSTQVYAQLTDAHRQRLIAGARF